MTWSSSGTASRTRHWHKLSRPPGRARRRLDPVQSLKYHEELLEFSTWLIAEAKSLMSELPAAARETATLELIPLECEARRLEERCRFWRAKAAELQQEHFP